MECLCGEEMTFMPGDPEAWICKSCLMVYLGQLKDPWVQCEDHQITEDRGRRVCKGCGRKMDCYSNDPMLWSCIGCGMYHLPDAPENLRWVPAEGFDDVVDTDDDQDEGEVESNEVTQTLW